MTLQKQAITVIGAGIGGIAVAVCLARQGARVTVLEQAAEITEVGAGLQISPNGLRVLASLGLADMLSRASVRAMGVRLRDYRQGAEVFHLPLGDRVGEAYHFVHRADLLDVLMQAAVDAGVTLRTGCKVVKVHPGTPARVNLAEGETLQADLVIGADGLHSVLRRDLNGVSAPQFTGQVAWRALAPNLIGHPPEVRVHMGPGKHMVSYPIRDGHTLNIVAVQERETWAEEGWTHSDSGDNLRAAFAYFHPDILQMLAGVDRVGLWGLFRHPVAHKWVGTGCALLGDAAHPTLPFMAQGANMALEDAWVLADTLAEVDDIQTGLAQYQARRQDRVEKVVATAAGNAWKYHLRQPLVRFAAHAALRVASKIAPQRMQRQFDWIYNYDVTKRTG